MSDEIKVYPHSSEAEEAVLGSILLGGNSVFEKCYGEYVKFIDVSR